MDNIEKGKRNGDWLRSLSNDELAEWCVTLVRIAKEGSMLQGVARTKNEWLMWLEEER